MIPYVPAEKKVFPEVGDILIIRHEVSRKPDGECLGVKRADRETKTTVTRVYGSNEVRSGIGDPWTVVPCGYENSKRKWQTINPFQRPEREKKDAA